MIIVIFYLGNTCYNSERCSAHIIFWSATVKLWHVQWYTLVKAIDLLFSVYEKMKEKMEEVNRELSGVKAMLFSWARDIGLRGNQNIQKG